MVRSPMAAFPMDALLYDAARTAMRSFRPSLGRGGVLVPVTWVGADTESAAIVVLDKRLALDHARSGGSVDDLARAAWVRAGGAGPARTNTLRWLDRCDALGFCLEPGFVVGAVPVQVLRVGPLLQAAAGGISQ